MAEELPWIETLADEGEVSFCRITPEGFERLTALTAPDGPELTEADRLLIDLLLQRLTVGEGKTAILTDWLQRGLDRGRVKVRRRYLDRLGAALATFDHDRQVALATMKADSNG